MKRLIAEGRIIFGKDETRIPQLPAALVEMLLRRDDGLNHQPLVSAAKFLMGPMVAENFQPEYRPAVRRGAGLLLQSNGNN